MRGPERQTVRRANRRAGPAVVAKAAGAKAAARAVEIARNTSLTAK